MNKEHIADLYKKNQNIGLPPITQKHLNKHNVDCSITLDDLEEVWTLGSKYDYGHILRVKGKERFSDMPIRISVNTLLSLSKKNKKHINLILKKKRVYFWIYEKGVEND